MAGMVVPTSRRGNKKLDPGRVESWIQWPGSRFPVGCFSESNASQDRQRAVRHFGRVACVAVDIAETDGVAAFNQDVAERHACAHDYAHIDTLDVLVGNIDIDGPPLKRATALRADLEGD